MAAVGAFTSMDQAEDLKAFERRIVELLDSLGPTANKWKFVFISTCFIAIVTAFGWLFDQQITEISFVQSLLNHKLFSLSCFGLLVMLLMGVHKRILIQSIILSRCRTILQDFNMSCDDRGRLILKPRPIKENESYYSRFYQGHG
ncbi:nuclear envelope phosphatase-regulatory subunit 1 [Hydra vulgaris]|uniref:Transmembrane protein 188 n=1 Tax=Hydra vulgaris TaxID=6087 RepID=T2M9Y2_HYDVU|nr:nuclear envelope phosphatase-regulatory subunit 1 [Hydra vulgaris]